MKSTGIVRKIDKMSRIVVPKELCKMFDIKGDEDSLEIFTEGDMIILKKYEPSCVFCNEARDTLRFGNKVVCKSCAEKLGALAKQQASQPDFPSEI